MAQERLSGFEREPWPTTLLTYLNGGNSTRAMPFATQVLRVTTGRYDGMENSSKHATQVAWMRSPARDGVPMTKKAHSTAATSIIFFPLRRSPCYETPKFRTIYSSKTNIHVWMMSLPHLEPMYPLQRFHRGARCQVVPRSATSPARPRNILVPRERAWRKMPFLLLFLPFHLLVFLFLLCCHCC